MGLNPRGRGRGGKAPFLGKGRRGGGMGGQVPVFRGPPGMYGPPPPPPMGFPPGPPFGGPFFPGPCGSNFPGRRPTGFGKFPRKNFKGRPQQKSNNGQMQGVDLTKPWVTEEIRNEEAKKQECLEAWRKSKDDGDWSKYKEQKQIVQTMYDNARTEYLSTRPNEASFWLATSGKRYHCDTCDKTFGDEEALVLHEEEHETCGRDGCEFTAHPKVVAKHVKMQHDTGLYKRMGKLYSEEDIKNWVEERKRRYPTKKVIEEKKAMEAEKAKRGERIKEDNNAFNKSLTKRKGKMRSFERKSMKVRRSRGQKKKRNEESEQSVSEALKEEASWRGSVPPFTGLSAFADLETKVDELDSNFSDDEWKAAEPVKSDKAVSEALSILAACYDSEVSPPDEEDAPEEVKTVRVKEEPATEAAPNKDRLQTRKKRRKRVRSGEDIKAGFKVPAKQMRVPTLLEKLLSSEIRHERNVILQCVRYVIDNNFFLESV